MSAVVCDCSAGLAQQMMHTLLCGFVSHCNCPQRQLYMNASVTEEALAS